jgi:hypothetical protein
VLPRSQLHHAGGANVAVDADDDALAACVDPELRDLRSLLAFPDGALGRERRWALARALRRELARADRVAVDLPLLVGAYATMQLCVTAVSPASAPRGRTTAPTKRIAPALTGRP